MNKDFKTGCWFYILMFFTPVLVYGQSLEIEGSIKLSNPIVNNSTTDVVVLNSDSTLAVRDASELFEYQMLERIEDTLFLSNGGFVILPPDEVNDADSDPSNELQELSINGDTLFISNSNFLVLPGLQFLSSLVPVLPVQERLDNGESPLSIYNSGVPLDSLYGKTYQGGYIFYLDTNDDLVSVEGMVASFSDIEFFGSFNWVWGCTTSEPLPIVTNSPPSGSSAEVGDGEQNTTTIDSHICSSNNDAAVKCIDGVFETYSDWYLPSIKELLLMWENLADSDGDDSNSGPADQGNLGGFEDLSYWSSTAGDDAGAWQIDFSNGSQIVQLRSSVYRVRAIRSF